MCNRPHLMMSGTAVVKDLKTLTSKHVNMVAAQTLSGVHLLFINLGCWSPSQHVLSIFTCTLVSHFKGFVVSCLYINTSWIQKPKEVHSLRKRFIVIETKILCHITPYQVSDLCHVCAGESLTPAMQ